MKTCSICKQELSLSLFHKRTYKTGNIGYQSKCKKCSIRIKKEKRMVNPVLRIIDNQKKRIRMICKEKGLKKTINFDKIFGIDQDGFRIHMESKFYGGITWENYINKIWQVDHIIGLKNIQTFEDLIRLCHYTNTQPLLIEDHKNKSKDDLNKTPIV